MAKYSVNTTTYVTGRWTAPKLLFSHFQPNYHQIFLIHTMPTVKREWEDDDIAVQTPFEYILDLNHPDTTLLAVLRKFMMQNESHVVTSTLVLERLVSWLDSDVVVGEHKENLLWVLTNLASGPTFVDFAKGRDELMSVIVEKTALKWVQERKVIDDFSKVFVQTLELLSHLICHGLVNEQHIEPFMIYFVEMLDYFFEFFADDFQNLEKLVIFISSFLTLKDDRFSDFYGPIGMFILKCWKRQPSLTNVTLQCLNRLVEKTMAHEVGGASCYDMIEWIKNNFMLMASK
ncbi:hypothetical protein PCE1_002952 [Barthelona sp. PCE]